MTVAEIYERDVKPLPPSERLRLATLILNDIPPQSVADSSDEWSDQDLTDFTQQNWKRTENGDTDAQAG